MRPTRLKMVSLASSIMSSARRSSCCQFANGNAQTADKCDRRRPKKLLVLHAHGSTTFTGLLIHTHLFEVARAPNEACPPRQHANEVVDDCPRCRVRLAQWQVDALDKLGICRGVEAGLELEGEGSGEPGVSRCQEGRTAARLTGRCHRGSIHGRRAQSPLADHGL